MSAQAVLEMRLDAKQFVTGMRQAEQAVEGATRAVDDAQRELDQFQKRFTTTERASGELQKTQKKLEAAVRSASKAFVAQKGALRELEERQRILSEHQRRSGGAIQGMVGQYDNFIKSSPKIVRAILAIVAALTAAVVTFAGFQQAVQDLSAISGIVGRDLEFLSDSARRLGASSRFTASEAAQAYQLVASAKPELLANVAALEEVTRQTLLLAEATGIDLPQAAEILAASLNQFGAGADQAGRFVNVLAASVRHGASSVTDTAEALKYAGSLAKLAGISFEDAAVAIMLMAQNKLVGSQAGTALVGTLSKLEQQMRLKLRPSAVGIQEVFRLLAEEGVDVNRAMALFGQEAAKGGSALVEYAGQWESVRDKITGTQTATEMATGRMNSIQGDWKTLVSQLQELGIRAVEAFGPEVRMGIQAVILLLQGLGAVATTVGALWLMVKLTLQAVLGGVAFLIVKIGQALTWLGEQVGIFSAGATAAVAEFADNLDYGVMASIQDTADLMSQLGADSESASGKLGGVGGSAREAAEDLDKLGRSWKTAQTDLAREFGLKMTKELQGLKVQLKYLDEGAGYVSVFTKALSDNMVITGPYEENLKKSGAAVQAFMDAIQRKTFLVEFNKEIDKSTQVIAWQLENLDKSPAVIQAVTGAIKSLVDANSSDMRAVIARTEAYERLEKFLQIAKGEDPFTRESQRISAEIAAIGRSESETAKLNIAKQHGNELSEQELELLFEQIDALEKKRLVSSFEKMTEELLSQITALKVSSAAIGDNGRALAKFTKLQALDNDAKRLGVEGTQEQRDAVVKYIDTLYDLQSANEAAGEFNSTLGDVQYEISVLEHIRDYNVAIQQQEGLRARLDAQRSAGNEISEDELGLLVDLVNRHAELGRIIDQKNAGESEQERLDIELQTLRYLRENNIALSQQAMVRDQLNAERSYGLGLTQDELDLIKKTIAAIYDENDAREQLSATVDIVKQGLKTLLNDALDGNKIELDKFFEYMRNRWRESFVEMMAEKITLQIQANVTTTGVGSAGGGGFSGNQAIAAFAGGAIAGSGGDTGSSNQQISGTVSGAMAGYQMSGSPYGAIIGAVVGAIASGVTTGTPWREVGREIAAQVIGGAASLQSVSLQERDQPFYGGVSNRERATELVGDQGFMLSEIWREITVQFADMAETIGIQGARSIIESFQGVFSVDVTDMSDEQVAEAVRDQFQKLGDLLVGQLLPLADGFRAAGESFTETLFRLYEATTTVNDGMRLLGLDVVDLIDPQYISDATAGLFQALAGETNDFIRMIRADIHENLFDRSIIGPDAPELMDAPELSDNGLYGVELTAVGEQISQLQEYIARYEEALLSIGDAAGASVIDGTDALSHADLTALIRHARERLDGLVVQYEEALAFAIMKFREGLVEAAGSPERLTELFQVYAETFMENAAATENVLNGAIADAQARATNALESLGTNREDFFDDFQAAQVGGIDPAVFVQWLQASELLSQLMALEVEIANARGESIQVASLTAEQQLQLSRDAESLRDSFAAMGIELGVSADAINQWVLDLAGAVGGLDNVSQGMEFVFSRFVERNEQLSMIMEEAAREIDALGMSVADFSINGREQFMKLFNEAVEAGDSAAIAMLLNLAPALDSWIVAHDEMILSIDQAADEFGAFADSMTSIFSGIGIDQPSGDIVSELGVLGYFQSIADALGGTDAAVDAFTFIWDEFVTEVDRSAATVAASMASISELGFDPDQLIAGGRQGFMDLLLAAAGDVEALTQLALVAPFLDAILDAQGGVEIAVDEIADDLNRLSRAVSGLSIPDGFADQLLELFGADELSDSLQFVWDNFMDDTQRSAAIIDEARASISGMGFDVDAMVAMGRQGFLDLLNSAIGDPEAYRQLLLIAPFLDAIFDAADEAGSAANQFDELGDAIRSAAANIQGAISSILQTPSSFAGAGPTAPLLSRITAGYSRLGQGTIRQQVDNINNLTSLIESRYQAEIGQLEQLMGVEQERVNARNSALQEQYAAEQRLYEQKRAEYDALMSKADGLRKFLDSLTVGPLSGATPFEAMAIAQGEYQQILSRAMAGDNDAIDQLQEVSRAYLEAARDVYASSPEYFQILDSVTASIRGVIASIESRAEAPGAAPSPPELIQISENTGRMAAIQADMVAAQERAVQELEALQVELERLELERQAQEQAYRDGLLLASQETAGFARKTAEFSEITSDATVDIGQLMGSMLAQDMARNAALFDIGRQISGLQVVYADGMDMVARSVSDSGDALRGLGDTLGNAVASSMRGAADRIVGAIIGLESTIEAAIESAADAGDSGEGDADGGGSGGTGIVVRDPNPRRRVVYGR